MEGCTIGVLIALPEFVLVHGSIEWEDAPILFVGRARIRIGAGFDWMESCTIIDF
jgi:hypothetical protein